MSTRPRENENGFTLIEVIMATLLLLIGIGIVGSVTTVLMRANFYSQRHTQAVILAQNTIEDLLNAGFHSEAMNPGVYEHPLNPVNATGDSSGVFTLEWTVYDLRPIERSRLIVCTVGWQTNYGGESTGEEGGEPESESVSLSAVCIDESN